MKGVKHLVLLIIIELSSISSKRLLSSNEIQDNFYFSSAPIISAQPYEITATPFPSSSISLNDIVSFTFIDDKQEEMLYCKELTAQCPNKLDVDDKTIKCTLDFTNNSQYTLKKIASSDTEISGNIIFDINESQKISNLNKFIVGADLITFSLDNSVQAQLYVQGEHIECNITDKNYSCYYSKESPDSLLIEVEINNVRYKQDYVEYLTFEKPEDSCFVKSEDFSFTLNTAKNNYLEQFKMKIDELTLSSIVTSNISKRFTIPDNIFYLEVKSVVIFYSDSEKKIEVDPPIKIIMYQMNSSVPTLYKQLDNQILSLSFKSNLENVLKQISLYKPTEQSPSFSSTNCIIDNEQKNILNCEISTKVSGNSVNEEESYIISYTTDCGKEEKNTGQSVILINQSTNLTINSVLPDYYKEDSGFITITFNNILPEKPTLFLINSEKLSVKLNCTTEISEDKMSIIISNIMFDTPGLFTIQVQFSDSSELTSDKTILLYNNEIEISSSKQSITLPQSNELQTNIYIPLAKPIIKEQIKTVTFEPFTDFSFDIEDSNIVLSKNDGFIFSTIQNYSINIIANKLETVSTFQLIIQDFPTFSIGQTLFIQGSSYNKIEIIETTTPSIVNNIFWKKSSTESVDFNSTLAPTFTLLLETIEKDYTAIELYFTINDHYNYKIPSTDKPISLFSSTYEELFNPIYTCFYKGKQYPISITPKSSSIINKKIITSIKDTEITEIEELPEGKYILSLFYNEDTNAFHSLEFSVTSFSIPLSYYSKSSLSIEINDLSCKPTFPSHYIQRIGEEKKGISCSEYSEVDKKMKCNSEITLTSFGIYSFYFEENKELAQIEIYRDFLEAGFNITLTQESLIEGENTVKVSSIEYEMNFITFCTLNRTNLKSTETTSEEYPITKEGDLYYFTFIAQKHEVYSVTNITNTSTKIKPLDSPKTWNLPIEYEAYKEYIFFRKDENNINILISLILNGNPIPSPIIIYYGTSQIQTKCEQNKEQPLKDTIIATCSYINPKASKELWIKPKYEDTTSFLVNLLKYQIDENDKCLIQNDGEQILTLNIELLKSGVDIEFESRIDAVEGNSSFKDKNKQIKFNVASLVPNQYSIVLIKNQVEYEVDTVLILDDIDIKSASPNKLFSPIPTNQEITFRFTRALEYNEISSIILYSETEEKERLTGCQVSENDLICENSLVNVSPGDTLFIKFTRESCPNKQWISKVNKMTVEVVTEDLFQIVSLPSVAIVGANQIIIQSKEQDYLLDRIKTITFSKKEDDIPKENVIFSVGSEATYDRKTNSISLTINYSKGERYSLYKISESNKIITFEDGKYVLREYTLVNSIFYLKETSTKLTDYNIQLNFREQAILDKYKETITCSDFPMVCSQIEGTKILNCPCNSASMVQDLSIKLYEEDTNIQTIHVISSSYKDNKNCLVVDSDTQYSLSIEINAKSQLDLYGYINDKFVSIQSNILKFDQSILSPFGQYIVYVKEQNSNCDQETLLDEVTLSVYQSNILKDFNPKFLLNTNVQQTISFGFTNKIKVGDIHSIILSPEDGENITCSITEDKIKNGQVECKYLLTEAQLKIKEYSIIYIDACGKEQSYEKTIEIKDQSINKVEPAFIKYNKKLDATFTMSFLTSTSIVSGTTKVTILKSDGTPSSYKKQYTLTKTDIENQFSFTIPNADILYFGYFKFQVNIDSSTSLTTQDNYLIYKTGISLSKSYGVYTIDEDAEILISFDKDTIYEAIDSIEYKKQEEEEKIPCLFELKSESSTEVLVQIIKPIQLDSNGIYTFTINSAIEEQKGTSLTYELTANQKYSITSIESSQLIMISNSISDIVIVYNTEIVNNELKAIHLVSTSTPPKTIETSKSVSGKKVTISIENPLLLTTGLYKIETVMYYQQNSFISTEQHNIVFYNEDDFSYNFNRFYFVLKESETIKINVTDKQTLIENISVDSVGQMDVQSSTSSSKTYEKDISKIGNYSFTIHFKNGPSVHLEQIVKIVGKITDLLSITTSSESLCNYYKNYYTVQLAISGIKEEDLSRFAISLVSDETTIEMEPNEKYLLYTLKEEDKEKVKDKTFTLKLIENLDTNKPLFTLTNIGFSDIKSPEYVYIDKSSILFSSLTCDLSKSKSFELSLLKDSDSYLLSCSYITEGLKCDIPDAITTDKLGEYKVSVFQKELDNIFISDTIQHADFDITYSKLIPNQNIDITITNTDRHFYMNNIEKIKINNTDYTREKGEITVKDNYVKCNLPYGSYVIYSIHRTQESQESEDEAKKEFEFNNVIPPKDMFTIKEPYILLNQKQLMLFLTPVTVQFTITFTTEEIAIKYKDSLVFKNEDAHFIPVCNYDDSTLSMVCYYDAQKEEELTISINEESSTIQHCYIILYSLTSNSQCNTIIPSQTASTVLTVTIKKPSAVTLTPIVKLKDITGTPNKKTENEINYVFSSLNVPYGTVKPTVILSKNSIEIEEEYSFYKQNTIDTFKALFLGQDNQVSLLSFSNSDFLFNKGGKEINIIIKIDSKTNKVSTKCLSIDTTTIQCWFDLTGVKPSTYKEIYYTSLCDEQLLLPDFQITIYDETANTFPITFDKTNYYLDETKVTITVSTLSTFSTFLKVYYVEEGKQDYLQITNNTFDSDKVATYTLAYSIDTIDTKYPLSTKIIVSDVSASLTPEPSSCNYKSDPMSFTVTFSEGSKLTNNDITVSLKNDTQNIPFVFRDGVFVFTEQDKLSVDNQYSIIVTTNQTNKQIYSKKGVIFTEIGINEYYFSNVFYLKNLKCAYSKIQLSIGDKDIPITCKTQLDRDNNLSCSFTTTVYGEAKISTSEETLIANTFISIPLDEVTFTIDEQLEEYKYIYHISNNSFYFQSVEALSIKGSQNIDLTLSTSSLENNTYIINEDNSITLQAEIETTSMQYTLSKMTVKSKDQSITKQLSNLLNKQIVNFNLVTKSFFINEKETKDISFNLDLDIHYIPEDVHQKILVDGKQATCSIRSYNIECKYKVSTIPKEYTITIDQFSNKEEKLYVSTYSTEAGTKCNGEIQLNLILKTLISFYDSNEIELTYGNIKPSSPPKIERSIDMYTITYIWNSPEIELGSVIIINNKKTKEETTVTNLQIRDIDSIEMKSYSGELYVKSKHENITLIFTSEINQGDIKLISLKHQNEEIKASSLIFDKENINATFDLSKETEEKVYFIFYTNLCGQSIKSTKSITLKGEETCEAPLIAVGPKCVSCEFIEKDSYYEIGEDGKGQCVKECKSYKYDGDHRCYNNCKDIFGYPIPHVGKTCYLQCPDGEGFLPNDENKKCVPCEQYPDFNLVVNGICHCGEGFIQVKENEKYECKLPVEVETATCNDYCLNGGYCYLVNNKPRCNCSKTNFVGLTCEIKPEEISEKVEASLNNFMNITFDVDNKTFLSSVITLSTLLRDNPEKIINKLTPNLVDNFVNKALYIEGEPKKALEVIGFALLLLAKEQTTSRLRRLQEINYYKDLALKAKTISYDLMSSTKGSYETYKVYSNILELQFINSNDVNGMNSYINDSRKKGYSYFNFTELTTKITKVAQININLDTNDYKNLTLLSISKNGYKIEEKITLYYNVEPLINSTLFNTYKENDIDIYNPNDKAFSEYCYYNTHFMYDLNQRYRMNKVFQNKTFIIKGLEDRCKYISITDNEATFNCLSLTTDPYYEDIYDSFTISPLEMNITTFEEHKDLSLICVKHINKIVNNFAFWFFLFFNFIIIAYNVVMIIISCCQEISDSFFESLENDNFYVGDPKQLSGGSNDKLGGIIPGGENVVQQKNFGKIIQHNFLELHPIVSIAYNSIITPNIVSSWFLLFNVINMFGFNAVYFSEDMFEDRIADKHRDNFGYPMKSEFDKIMSAISTSVLLALFVRLLVLVPYFIKNDLADEILRAKNQRNKFGVIQDFNYRMLPRRIIALVFIVLLDVFFWYYTIVFCGIYVNAQYGWFYSGIWSLMWVWVVYAPIYILIISLFEHCGNQCCVYYMKRFFIF